MFEIERMALLGHSFIHFLWLFSMVSFSGQVTGSLQAHKVRQPFALTHTHAHLRAICSFASSPHTHVFGLWEEAGALGTKLMRVITGRTYKIHTGSLCEPAPFLCFEAAALNTASPFCPSRNGTFQNQIFL